MVLQGFTPRQLSLQLRGMPQAHAPQAAPVARDIYFTLYYSRFGPARAHAAAQVSLQQSCEGFVALVSRHHRHCCNCNNVGVTETRLPGGCTLSCAARHPPQRRAAAFSTGFACGTSTAPTHWRLSLLVVV